MSLSQGLEARNPGDKLYQGEKKNVFQNTYGIRRDLSTLLVQKERKISTWQKQASGDGQHWAAWISKTLPGLTQIIQKN